ncbi:MAG: prepilin-type N-terminal cleavage/methylation domain-containing protein, partial [Candidatus Muiribacteriota bacterium]
MNKAFTLIEILIVLVIISIISIFMIPYVTNTINDARITRVSRDFSDIKNYVQSYYNQFSKESRQTDIGPIAGSTLPLLEYTPFEFGVTDPLEYLDKEFGFKFTKDPWGTPYQIFITSSTLPDRVIADFSTSNKRIYLLKIFSLNRALFDNPGNLTTYHLAAGNISISFRYRTYFVEKANDQPNLGNIRLYYSTSIHGSAGSPSRQEGGINLSTMNIGPIDESHRRTETRIFNAVTTAGINN